MASSGILAIVSNTYLSQLEPFHHHNIEKFHWNFQRHSSLYTRKTEKQSIKFSIEKIDAEIVDDLLQTCAILQGRVS